MVNPRPTKEGYTLSKKKKEEEGYSTDAHDRYRTATFGFKTSSASRVDHDILQTLQGGGTSRDGGSGF